MALTDMEVKNLKPKDKLYRKADFGGLCIEVTPGGSKLWRWRYTYFNKPQMLALGKYPAVSISEARRLRDVAKAVLDSGKNPAREKKAEKLRKSIENDNTFEKLARKWLDLNEGQLNQKYHKQRITRMEQHVFPMIGDLPITEITIPDIVRVVEKIAEGGAVVTAKRMKQLISQIFRYAAQKGFCVHNPAADIRNILPPKQEKHHAAIKPPEFPALLKKMDSYQGDDLTIAALRLISLTFVRTGELIGAKWDEIDWDREEWNIPAERMKMKRPHLVPLSKQALSILRVIQRQTGDKPFIFYSRRSKKHHISNGAILMALRRMGYQNVMTGHGFRSLASTILNEKGYSPDAIEKQLAHGDNDKIRASYNFAEYLLERKKMMQDYADMQDEMRAGLPNKQVLTFSRDRKG